MYKICFYVPDDSVELVKNALFRAGAGHIGNYDQCAWQVRGTGQFRPLDKSEPFIGQHNQLEKVSEYRVEMVCATTCIEAVICALHNSHPYEEPAYDVIQLADL